MPFHKKTLGAIAKFGLGLIPGGSTALTIGEALLPGKGAHNGTPHHGRGGLCFHGESQGDCDKRLGKDLGKGIKFGSGIPPSTFPISLAPGTQCRFPRRIDPRTGECRVFLGAESGRDRPVDERGRPRLAPPGDAVMGQFGAALEPGVMQIERSVCLPGMQLAKDGLCYNKGAITNSQRMWPRGRRPLLTGGDMRAIGVAARAGAKLDRTTKRLRSLGMMKALPAPRKPRAHAHAKPVAAVSV